MPTRKFIKTHDTHTQRLLTVMTAIAEDTRMAGGQDPRSILRELEHQLQLQRLSTHAHVDGTYFPPLASDVGKCPTSLYSTALCSNHRLAIHNWLLL